VNAPTRLITISRSEQLLDVDAQDLGEAY